MGSSSASALFELLLLLVAATLLLELLARRVHLPAAGALLLGGIILALIPGTPNIELDPDLTLVLFLPPLLQASAWFTPWREFRADLRIIMQLAVGAVVFTTAAVGVVTHLLLPQLPWAACFALGAIISPPDAVAAKAVLHGVSLPRRVVLLLEGESLVNDATGLVLYRFAVIAALTGAFDAGDAVISFGALAVGGIVVGVLCGLALGPVFRWLKDSQIIIILSFLMAWGSYLLAESLHVSGVLATVAAGLIGGWRQHIDLDAATRIRARAVWDVAVFVLESLVFILVGLQLRGVLVRLGGWEASLSLLPAVLGIVLTVIVSRFFWILPITYGVRAAFPSIRRRDPAPPLSVPIVMSWAGMRGVVSLAAALALPEQFPGRDFILAATFAVILATVLIQGGTLALLIRLLRPTTFELARQQSLTEAAARAVMVKAQLKAVEHRGHNEDGTERHPRLLEQYAYRARAAEHFSQNEHDLLDRRHEHFSVVLGAVAAGRKELLRLHREGRIDDEVLQALEQELDLDEMSARRIVGEH